MTVCLASRQRAKLFVKCSSTRRKNERTVSAKARHVTKRETGWTGSDAKRVAHDAMGNRTDERERGMNSAWQSGRTVRVGRKRRANGARQNGTERDQKVG